MKIYSNKIRCKHCGDVIESKHVHDFKYCSCGKCAVDGGLEYLRRIFTGSVPEDDYEELSEYDAFDALDVIELFDDEEPDESYECLYRDEKMDDLISRQDAIDALWKGVWIEPKEKYATPGGDPVWVCSVCGGDTHVCGIETAYNEHHVCKNCGSYNKYPYELVKDKRT